MKDRITYILKNNRYVLRLYEEVFTLSINFIKLFIKPDDKIILFNSFGGKKFDDSPMEIYQAMKKDSRFSDYKLYWAFHEPNKFKKISDNIIKTDSLEYFIVALKARVWVTNSSLQRNIRFKGRETFYLNTWHGTPIKKMGADIGAESTMFRDIDAFLVQGDYEKKIFNRAFNIPIDKFKSTGLPRNDILVNVISSEKEKLKNKLGICNSKKIILYAPTYRDYENSSKSGNVSTLQIDFKKWRKLLPDDYVLVIRAHYEVSKLIIKNELTEGFVYDLSDYHNLSDLLISADILISDYSSIFFDYSLMGKPMISYAYDYDIYKKSRGLYLDIHNEILGGSIDEDELISIVLKIIDNNIEAKRLTCNFRKNYVNYYGSASEKSLEIIYRQLRKSGENA